MIRKLLPLWLFLCIVSFQAAGLEVSSLFHMGNLSFDKEAETFEDGISGSEFPYGVSAYATETVNDSLILKAGLFYDPILRYSTYALFEYRQDYISLSVGPFFGTLNTPGSILQAGISTTVKAQIPGILYASLRSDSTIGGRFTKDGDYIQELSELSVGYYIPNAICSVNMSTKSFIVRESAILEIDDTLTEYSFKVDIFQKNIPFGILLSFGYQTLSRSYTDTSTSVTEENKINSIVLGTNFSFQASDAMRISADLESSVYSFGSADDGTTSSPLTIPDTLPQAYLFRSTVGVTWSF
jgi:hypothetical protein